MNAHLSVAFTHVLYLINSAAISTCWKTQEDLNQHDTDKIHIFFLVLEIMVLRDVCNFSFL